LALAHEKGDTRCSVVLQGNKLMVFDLRTAPEFAFSSRYRPQSETEFV
jgi:hypothetical protein